MNTEISIEDLLRWRLAKAESEAPPAPRAARLLALTRPWWETWPERFKMLVERLAHVQVGYGHAMSDPQNPRSGHPVAALIVRTVEQLETSAQVLYFNISQNKLRLRFHLESASVNAEPSFEVTFISGSTAQPLFSAVAALSVDTEYRIDADLPEGLAEDWARLKVTDRMPFRLILHPETPRG
jgi:hypothetical protein